VKAEPSRVFLFFAQYRRPPSVAGGIFGAAPFSLPGVPNIIPPNRQRRTMSFD